MSDSNVADRLKSFIERKGLSYSQFADTCGIPRPSLSQLLTGRNKKISDVMVGQIHNMFPELSIVWLLFGEGPMENLPHNTYHKESETDDTITEGLFSLPENALSDSKKIVFPSDRRNGAENLQGESLKSDENARQLAEYKIERLQSKIKELQSQIDNLQKNPRKAVQVIVYYDDNSFETFKPS